MKKKTYLTGAVLFVCLVLYLLGSYNVQIPYLDRKADEYFTSTSKMAILGYATTRLVNAAVSVVKESSFEVGVGAGANIAAGQFLDPIDDLTEKLSNVFLLVIVSLGIQKLAMIIGNMFTFKAGAFFLLFIIPAIWSGREFFVNLSSFALKVVVVLLALRFFLPASAIVNDLIYSQVIGPKIEEAKRVLNSYIKVSEEEIEDLSESAQAKEEDGWWDRLKEKVFSIGKAIKAKALTAFKVAKNIILNIDEVTSAMVKLAISYIALFVIQCLVIPLLMLWLIVRFLDVVFKTRFEEKFMERLKGQGSPSDTSSEPSQLPPSGPDTEAVEGA